MVILGVPQVQGKCKITEDDTIDPSLITDDIREMRKVECKICQEVVLGHGLKSHLLRKHKTLLSNYGPLQYIKNTFYRLETTSV